jgi:endogenous inhibitor of DNA gyrase (YacG/DUF329 family)
VRCFDNVNVAFSYLNVENSSDIAPAATKRCNAVDSSCWAVDKKDVAVPATPTIADPRRSLAGDDSSKNERGNTIEQG